MVGISKVSILGNVLYGHLVVGLWASSCWFVGHLMVGLFISNIYGVVTTNDHIVGIVVYGHPMASFLASIRQFWASVWGCR